MDKIPCVVLVYFDFESIRITLDALAVHAGALDLIVVENPSPSTAALIRPYVDGLLANGTVASYYLFERNISNNAYQIVLDRLHDRIRRSPHVIVTDGDLLVHDPSWLGEEIGVLDRHPDVFACGVSLDMDNLPLATFSDAGGWVPPIVADHGDYLEGVTGMQLVAFRGEELAGFLDYRAATGLHFLDSDLHVYAYGTLTKRWARTKRATARHLTWDRYADLSHPYTTAKLARSFEQIWRHSDRCPYSLYTQSRPV
jgi:hypothetical protein